MPVPVTPNKDLSTAVPSNDTVPTSDPSVMAGYKDCLREAIRFLLQEEKLSENHPMVSGLTHHLSDETIHLDKNQMSEQLTASLEGPDAPPSSENVSKEGFKSTRLEQQTMEIHPQKAGYEVVFEEIGAESDVEMEDEEEEDFENDPDPFFYFEENFKNKLLRLFFQGCDLVAAPNSEICNLRHGEEL